MRSPVSGEKSSSSVSIATSWAKSWKTSGRESSPSSETTRRAMGLQADPVAAQREGAREAERVLGVPLRLELREALEEGRLAREDRLAAAHEVRRPGSRPTRRSISFPSPSRKTTVGNEKAW